MGNDTIAPGLTLGGRYRLLRPLGSGGMGSVWLAENDRQQEVAVKMLAAGLELAPEILERFKREATTTNAIGHAGVVRVIDSGATPWGTPFLVMERLVGVAVSDFAASSGRLTPARAAAIVVPLLDALAATHAAGVVHRDLKPSNVFINLEPVPAIKLLDFGISRPAAGQALTATGVALGTPAYMAPEQVVDTRSAGPAADVYAVGAILFELLAGRPVFRGDNPLLIAARVVNETPPSLATLVPELPRALAALVDSALSRAPEARPASADVFKRELERLGPSDSAGLFAAAWEQLRQERAGAGGQATPAPVPSPRPPARRGFEINAALLLKRTERPLPPQAAVSVVHGVLLDPAAPPVVTTGTLLLSGDGSVRAAPGAARVASVGASLRSTTPVEAWKGRPTPATLQFSAGAVLFELLTARPLFEASSETELEQALRSGVVPALGPGVPPALHAVIRQLVDPQPERRFPTPGEAAKALEVCFGGAFDGARARLELGALVRNASSSPQGGAARAPEPARGKGAGNGVQALLLVLVIAAVVAAVGAWRVKQKLDQQPPGTTVELTSPLEQAPEPPPPAEPPRPRADATLEVETVPSGATLFINGEPHGVTPGTLTLTPEVKWHLELRRAGYRTRTIELTPRSGPNETISVKLEPE